MRVMPGAGAAARGPLPFPPLAANVEPVTRIDLIIAGAAQNHVVPATTRQDVVPIATVDAVIAATAADLIVAAQAEDQVIAGAATDRVIARRAHDHLVEVHPCAFGRGYWRR